MSHVKGIIRSITFDYEDPNEITYHCDSQGKLQLPKKNPRTQHEMILTQSQFCKTSISTHPPMNTPFPIPEIRHVATREQMQERGQEEFQPSGSISEVNLDDLNLGVDNPLEIPLPDDLESYFRTFES